MKGWKLFTLRKDGTLGPLFINRRQRISLGTWEQSGLYPTKGFAVREGWHICSKRSAPHLSKKGRVWARVSLMEYTEHRRPKSQGGLWYTARWMRVDKIERRRK